MAAGQLAAVSLKAPLPSGDEHRQRTATSHSRKQSQFCLHALVRRRLPEANRPWPHRWSLERLHGFVARVANARAGGQRLDDHVAIVQDLERGRPAEIVDRPIRASAARRTALASAGELRVSMLSKARGKRTEREAPESQQNEVVGATYSSKARLMATSMRQTSPPHASLIPFGGSFMICGVWPTTCAEPGKTL